MSSINNLNNSVKIKTITVSHPEVCQEELWVPEHIKEKIHKLVDWCGIEGALSCCEKQDSDPIMQKLYYKTLIQDCEARGWEEALEIRDRIKDLGMKFSVRLELDEFQECCEDGYAIESLQEKGRYFSLLGWEARQLGMPWKDYLRCFKEAKKAFKAINKSAIAEMFPALSGVSLNQLVFEQLIPLILESRTEIIQSRTEILKILNKNLGFYNSDFCCMLDSNFKNFKKLKSAFEVLRDPASMNRCTDHMMKYASEQINESPKPIMKFLMEMVLKTSDPYMKYDDFMKTIDVITTVVDSREKLIYCVKRFMAALVIANLSTEAKSSIIETLVMVISPKITANTRDALVSVGVEFITTLETARLAPDTKRSIMQTLVEFISRMKTTGNPNDDSNKIEEILRILKDTITLADSNACTKNNVAMGWIPFIEALFLTNS